MQDKPVAVHRGAFTISTNRRRLDLEVVHRFLDGSHWAAGIPLAVLERAIANSICFGLYQARRQVGFARVVTDLATYAYLTDVFVLEEARGLGLGRWLVECILAHPELQGLRRIALFTRDAPWLYTRLGFAPSSGPSTYLEIRTPDAYRGPRIADQGSRE